jgi:maltooligosyltrehalose trehalohydrolase
MNFGAFPIGRGICRFTVWAPFREGVSVRLLSPDEKLVPMERDGHGYWKAEIACETDSVYMYQLDEVTERPDPASHSQPWGVHGPSQVVDHRAFPWTDDEWEGIHLREMIIYEIHTGTFTPEGTFDALGERLQAVRDLGINTIELMPVAQFPGERNWGYDGVYPFAVQHSYGGADGLKRLVNRCHEMSMAVVLDVVYNHLGPEGNYFSDFGPYFTSRYNTPWGDALNFDGAYSNDVRNFFIMNALHWYANFHIDALRLDAIHGITDMSAKPFLRELAEKVAEFSKSRRKVYLIAESDLNDTRVVDRGEHGFGHDAQWCDDFHHSLHALLTGEKCGYYIDFGRTDDMHKAMAEGFVFCGQYSCYRKRNHGVPSSDIPADRFIVFSQNHDQIGNRFFGERLSVLLPFESLKLAAGLVLLSPYVPLLFMGEEYGEENPFLYFIDHPDSALVEAVREGRKEEFKEFSLTGEPPDPADVSTFIRSKLDWDKRNGGRHGILLGFYKVLIDIRKRTPGDLSRGVYDVRTEGPDILMMKRRGPETEIFCLFNLGREMRETAVRTGEWGKMLDSSASEWGGTGSHLPDRIRPGMQIALQGSSLALFEAVAVKREFIARH